MTTSELIAVYYEGLARKSGWESAVSEDLAFFGNGADIAPRSRGRSGYAEVLKRFEERYEEAHVRKTLVDGENAFVVVSYDLVSPGGKRMRFDIGEAWKAHDGKLESLTLYYDTAAFNAFMSG